MWDCRYLEQEELVATLRAELDRCGSWDAVQCDGCGCSSQAQTVEASSPLTSKDQLEKEEEHAKAITELKGELAATQRKLSAVQVTLAIV